MKAFIERYVLGVFVVVVGVFVFGVNPLAWDLQQRVAAFIAFSALAFLAALLLENKRGRKTQRIRSRRNIALVGLVVSVVWFSTDTLLSRRDQHSANRSQTNSTAVPSTVTQQTSGSNSPAVANTTGDVNINTNAQSIPEKKRKKK